MERTAGGQAFVQLLSPPPHQSAGADQGITPGALVYKQIAVVQRRKVASAFDSTERVHGIGRIGNDRSLQHPQLSGFPVFFIDGQTVDDILATEVGFPLVANGHLIADLEGPQGAQDGPIESGIVGHIFVRTRSA